MKSKLCANCNKEIDNPTKNTKYCSDLCSIVFRKSLEALRNFKVRNEQINGGALLSSNLVQYEFVNLLKVFVQQYKFCAFCRQNFDSFLETTVDHIVPISKGGSHTYDNIQLIHKDCNSSKNDVDPEDLTKSIYKRLWSLKIKRENKKADEIWNTLSEEEKQEKLRNAVENLF